MSVGGGVQLLHSVEPTSLMCRLRPDERHYDLATNALHQASDATELPGNRGQLPDVSSFPAYKAHPPHILPSLSLLAIYCRALACADSGSTGLPAAWLGRLLTRAVNGTTVALAPRNVISLRRLMSVISIYLQWSLTMGY